MLVNRNPPLLVFTQRLTSLKIQIQGSPAAHHNKGSHYLCSLKDSKECYSETFHIALWLRFKLITTRTMAFQRNKRRPQRDPEEKKKAIQRLKSILKNHPSHKAMLTLVNLIPSLLVFSQRSTRLQIRI